uniref:Uncharacterized protein n=1 Tax=Denticeps clupeoides TaxID=299321 RepID=A0AAY4BE61_9TELE
EGQAHTGTPEVKFPDTRMSQLMQDLLEFRLNGVNCIPTSAGVLAQELSEALVRLARTVSPPRYKLLCIVTLGQSSQGGVVLVSQALWDCHSDTSVSHTFHGPRMFCTATVFAVYHE